MTPPAARQDDAVRRRIAQDPADADAWADGIRILSDPASVFRWYRRLMTVTDRVGGDVLRRALEASRGVDVPTLRRFGNSTSPSMTVRSRLILPFIGAALLAGDRVDLAALTVKPTRYGACRDNFERTLSALSEKTIPASVPEALEIMTLKQQIGMTLNRAGYLSQSAWMGRNVSTFIRRIRSNLYGNRFRSLTDLWTFAIGHMVVLAFLVKGQESGVLDFRGVKVWKGKIANSYLWDRIAGLSERVEVVPAFSTFADNHYSLHLEWVDDRLVDYFEACGIIADRAGDGRGAVLEPSGGSDTALAAFRESAGFAPTEPFVTVHCREIGFRAKGLRDTDINTYLPALEALARRGYRIVRLGDASMAPLPALPGLFDYARSPLKSPELDVLLPSAAAFHLGSSSGLSLVPLLFGTPCLFLNWYPFDMLPWGRRNWTVLKPIEATADRRRVTDRASYSKLGRIGDRLLLQSFGYDVVDLGAAEIVRAVDAFVAHLEHGPAEPAEAGPNIGRILAVDDQGRLGDLS